MKVSTIALIIAVSTAACFSDPTTSGGGDSDSYSKDESYLDDSASKTPEAPSSPGVVVQDPSCAVTAPSGGSFVVQSPDLLLAPVEVLAYEDVLGERAAAEVSFRRELKIVLTESAGECSMLAHGKSPASRKELRIVVRAQSHGAGDVQPPAAIDVGSYTASGDAKANGLALEREAGAVCGPLGTVSTHEEIVEGKVTITSRDALAIRGEVDVKDPSGGRIHFTFVTPTCGSTIAPASGSVACCPP